MLDQKLLRENFEEIKAKVDRRGKEYNISSFTDLDIKRRELLGKIEEMKSIQNQTSKEIPILKKEGKDVCEIMKKMKDLSDKISAIDPELKDVESKIHDLMLSIPNTPNDSVPEGNDDEDNIFMRSHLEPTNFDFEPLPHWEIGLKHDILDFDRATKISGARFTVYKGLGARLERAITNFMLDTHTGEHGYTEILPPVMMNPDSMRGTGQLPKFADDMFKIENNGFYMAPTAEVPVTNLYRNEILNGSDLTIKHTAYTPCFRAEAGSAGRDTRGLIRQHQFNKVELVKFTKPEDSYNELEKLTNDAENILKLLNIPYRVVKLCTGDLGFSSAMTYDIEVWMPSYNRYVEISSCSNFEDYQARRANIKYKENPKDKAKFVHTLNGSGLAVGRTTAAILENFQQKDGSVIIPDVLIPYMGNIKEIK